MLRRQVDLLPCSSSSPLTLSESPVMYAGLRPLQGLYEVEHGRHAEITRASYLPHRSYRFTAVTTYIPRHRKRCFGGEASPNVNQTARGLDRIASNLHFRYKNKLAVNTTNKFVVAEVQ